MWIPICLLLLEVVSLASAGRVCERGKFCSLGKTKGYIGPLDTAAQLKEALEATSFEKELIVFADTRINDASQALARFREAGYGHVLAIMEEPMQCQHLRSVFLPWTEEGPISCGTYATADENGVMYPSKFKYLKRPIGVTAWWRKWLTAGRAVALGYNVMAVDADVLVVDDWYWRAKQPPLSSFNMLSQNEWGVNFNGGFSYIQNASPTGPVAWILYDHLHRVVRWAEDDSALREASPAFRNRQHVAVDDQGMIQECVFSAVSGRPIYPAILSLFGNDEEAYKKMGTTESGLYKALHDPVRTAWREEERHEVPAELAPSVCEHYTKEACDTETNGTAIISTVTLKMPHSGGKYPIELGGYPFNRTVGPFTLAYRAAYKELGVPLPPDPEDPATEAAAAATKTEQFGYMAHRRSDEDCVGCWAEGTWWTNGRHGWWHRHLQGDRPRKAAIGHIWANLFPGDYQKEAILMLTGHYNWRVAARVAKSRQRVYIANQGHGTPEVRAVVAFQPGVVHAGMTKEQFVQAAQGLAQVAVTLGAIAAWPAAPCDADWALRKEVRATIQRPIQHRIPWSYLDTAYQVQPFGDSLEHLQCEWPGFGHAECLATRSHGHDDIGRGMLAVEFHHLCNTTRAEPRPETTIALGGASAAAPPPDNTVRQRVPYKDLLLSNAETVLRRLQREQMPVFWLDRLVEVTDMGGEAAATYKRWHERCNALRYLELPERDRERW